MKKIIKGSVMASLIIIGAISGMMLMWTFEGPIEQTLSMREWQPLETGAPAAGESGVVGVFIYPRQATPATAYQTNCTTGTAYAHGTEIVTSGDNALTGNVPYDTAFDIVVRVRWNKTCAYSTTNSTWMPSWVNASISAQLDNDGDTVFDDVTTYFPIVALDMGEANVSGCTTDTYIWVQYYCQAKASATGAGYQITHGADVNCSDFQAWAYF